VGHGRETEEMYTAQCLHKVPAGVLFSGSNNQYEYLPGHAVTLRSTSD
jgi:hypothetical protein